MSPASYLTAPPRVAADIVAPVAHCCSARSGKVAAWLMGTWHGCFTGSLRTFPKDAPTLAVLAGQARAEGTLDLGQVARLLHLSAGIVRTETRPVGRVIPFRAAGSAGARFPQEVYVAVPTRTADLQPGVHAYQPVEHALVQVGPPPAGDAPAIIVTGVPWRTGWRYRERGYRHIFWDSGTMLSQLLALAASAGLPCRLYTEFPDMEVRDLVGANGIDEFPIAVVAVGEGAPGWTPSERAAAGSVADDP